MGSVVPALGRRPVTAQALGFASLPVYVLVAQSTNTSASEHLALFLVPWAAFCIAALLQSAVRRRPNPEVLASWDATRS